MARAQEASFAGIMVRALCFFIVGDAIRSNFSSLTQGAGQNKSGLRAVVVHRHRLQRIGTTTLPPPNRDRSDKWKYGDVKSERPQSIEEQLLIEWQNGYEVGRPFGESDEGANRQRVEAERAKRRRFEAFMNGFDAKQEWQRGHSLAGKQGGSEEDHMRLLSEQWQSGTGAEPGEDGKQLLIEWQSGYGADERIAEEKSQRHEKWMNGYLASQNIITGPKKLLNVIELRLDSICGRYGDKVTFKGQVDERHQYAQRNVEYAGLLSEWNLLKDKIEKDKIEPHGKKKIS